MCEIIAGLKRLNPSVRVIATGSGQGDEMALRALCAGAKGFLDESARAEESKEAIRVVDSVRVTAIPRNPRPEIGRAHV